MNLLNKALRRMSGWSRTTWCLAILMTVALVLIGRLAQLQVFDTFDLEKKNLLQVQVDRKLQSPRGTIYDRNGKPLAMSVVTKSLYADPKMIKQSPQEIAELISPYVTMSKENIVKALQEDSAFVWINRMMDADKSKAVAQVIKDNNIAGLNFVEESKRYYPNGVLAAQILGFVGTDDKGLDGLEMVLDDELKGGVQQEIVATDNKGNAIFGSVLSKFLPDKGKSVTLTIDATIQFMQNVHLIKRWLIQGLNMLVLSLWILRLVKFLRWRIVQVMILTIIIKVGKRLSKILLLLTYTNQVLHSNQSLHLQLLLQESGN